MFSGLEIRAWGIRDLGFIVPDSVALGIRVCSSAAIK